MPSLMLDPGNERDLIQRFTQVEEPGLIVPAQDDIAGLNAWMWFTEIFPREPEDLNFIALQALFDEFMKRLPMPPPPGGAPMRHPPRVFVSHQFKDMDWARRIAWLVNAQGVEFWLDAFDHSLRHAGATILPTDPRYPYLIAAIVEMALLNCTHVIALHTINSQSSKWVPYELGRAKARIPVSRQAAGWFEPGLSVGSVGEYVLLTVRTSCKKDIHRWLSPITASPPKPGPWPAGEPTPAKLPNE